MPIRKINRIISINALKNFKLSENVTLSELFFLGNKKDKFDIDDLGYFVGPILNAGGRLGKSSYATELLSTNNIDIIKLQDDTGSINNCLIIENNIGGYGLLEKLLKSLPNAFKLLTKAVNFVEHLIIRSKIEIITNEDTLIPNIPILIV